ncbi:MAG TPA: hypothetical protein VHY56_01530 [Candidatus Binataceae bacterium]|nr:hypothetical protein [Candidatus Binataceae bacterium]
MKRLFTIVSATLVTGALALPAMAQGFPSAWPQPASYGYYHPTPPYPDRYADNHPYVADFNPYFDNHPELREQLSANPRLIDNPGYMAAHPELHEYMWTHPRVADSFRDRPYRFVHDEHAFNHLRWDRDHHRWCR